MGTIVLLLVIILLLGIIMSIMSDKNDEETIKAVQQDSEGIYKGSAHTVPPDLPPVHTTSPKEPQTGTQKLYKPPQTERYEYIESPNYADDKRRTIYGVFKVFNDGSISDTDWWENRSVAKAYLEYKNRILGYKSEDSIDF